VADRISDTVLDAFSRLTPIPASPARQLVTTNRVVLGRRDRGPGSVTPELLIHLARMAIHDIGYEQEGFHWQNAHVECHLHAQSAHIALGVDAAATKDEGAGDQGIMFGYACTETPELMPRRSTTRHTILRRISELRRINDKLRRRPAARRQVAGHACATSTASRSAPTSSRRLHPARRGHGAGRDQAMLWPLVESTLPKGWMCPEAEFYVNPTGQFVIGGPDGDCGLTGRKIIVDTYGGAAPHGGGAFSGKDPTKVDRSAAYAARYVAKNVVAAGLADKCTIQVSYAIGVSKPLSVYFDLHGTGRTWMRRSWPRSGRPW
jgi:S-adenosylmethionine synthetase